MKATAPTEIGHDAAPIGPAKRAIGDYLRTLARLGLLVTAGVVTFVILLYYNYGEVILHTSSGLHQPDGTIIGATFRRTVHGPNWLIPTVGAGTVLIVGLIAGLIAARLRSPRSSQR